MSNNEILFPKKGKKSTTANNLFSKNGRKYQEQEGLSSKNGKKLEALVIAAQNGQTAVSARMLYDFLTIKSNFTTWCERIFSYGFIEGEDYSLITTDSTGGRRATDYALTLECAQAIACMQRNQAGQQARRYLVSIATGRIQLAAHTESILSELQALLIALRTQQQPPNATPAALPAAGTSATLPAPQPVAAISEYLTLAEYCRMIGRALRLPDEPAQLGRQLAEASRAAGYKIGRQPHPRFARVNTYHRSILEQVLGTKPENVVNL